MKTLEQITTQLEALNEQAASALATAEGDSTKIEEVKSVIDELKPQIDVLTAERDAALQAKAMEDMKADLTTLQGVIEDLRKPSGEFVQPGAEGGKAVEDYQGSVFLDIRLANKGDQDARKRLTEGMKGLNAEGKAMTEGTPGQGGYLVRPQVERQIVEALESDNVLRSLCSSISVNTNAIQLDQLALSTTAGWVAELASKPESTSMSLATVTASVFTAAGLATISNQLLADSDPAVDGLVTADLAKRLVALEETAFLNGSGSGQPLGILNTPGIDAVTYTEASPTVAALLDKILDAVANVETNHGSPTAILMHPRTWTRILKAKDSAGAWQLNPGLYGQPADPRQPRTGYRGPDKLLWGVPVVTSNRIPTNLGGGTNESRVIVGDFREALILDRQGITVDESPHVLFTTNQTIFRAEKRVGFTAARTPLAFSVIGGTGLAAG